MAKDVQSLSSSIIEISSKDNVTKEVTMIVHKIDFANGNGLDFKEEYVNTYKDTIINKPVVAKYIPLQDDLGGHEPIFDANGNIIGLETIAIGTIKEAWIDNLEIDSETTVKALYAKADLWNYKYPEIVSCVERLFNSGNADSSVEVEIYSYGENPTQEYRYATNYTYIGNALLGSTIQPADFNAGVISIAQKEIAMAVKNDLQNLEKDEQKGVKEMSKTEVFNKGNNIKFHIEASELSHDDIRQQIYNFINPVNPETDERSYKYWIREVFQTYFIIEGWDDDKLYKVNYSVDGESVSINSEWTEVEITYQAVGSNLETEINTLTTQLNQAKEELSSMSETKTQEVVELESKITELESKIAELNSTIVSQEESKTELEGKIQELSSEVETLKPFKEQIEKAEKEAKVQELNEKYSKLLSEETFKSEETQIALQSLDSAKLNEIVVNEVAKQKVVETEIASKTDDVVVTASKQEDLLPQQDVVSKYGLTI